MDYVKQGQDFLEKHSIAMTFRKCAPKWSEWEGNAYKVTIRRRQYNQSMTITFHDSICNTQKGLKPSAYDVLACLIKHEPIGDIWDYAREYGFKINSKDTYEEAKQAHKAMLKEYKDVIRLFWDIIEKLQEIN